MNRVALLLELIGDDKSVTLTIGTETIAAIKAMNAYVEQMARFEAPSENEDEELEAWATMIERAKVLADGTDLALTVTDLNLMPASDLCLDFPLFERWG